VVLGWLDGTALLGGALPIDRAAAEAAIVAHVAEPLRLDAREAARRIVDVVHANMAQALRIVSVERGHDPAEFSLIAFGGAGPVHAAFLAAELGIPEVIVPPAPGAFSALGLVAGDLRRDWSRTLYAELDSLDPATLGGVVAEMEAAGRTFLDATAIPEEQRALLRQADLRYRRQAYELTVPVASGPIAAGTIVRLAADFHALHEQTYGHANPSEPVQLVNLRLTAVGRLPELMLRQPTGAAASSPRWREAWFAETGAILIDVHWRAGLAEGARVPGPAVIESLDSTTLIPPGWTAWIDAAGFIRLTRTQGG
ncbi:MAG: hydantoinase/oxoprolinase family protein, partial [Acetobacteraceae bacterium]